RPRLTYQERRSALSVERPPQGAAGDEGGTRARSIPGRARRRAGPAEPRQACRAPVRRRGPDGGRACLGLGGGRRGRAQRPLGAGAGRRGRILSLAERAPLRRHLPAALTRVLRVAFVWSGKIDFQIGRATREGDRVVVRAVADGAPGRIVLVRESGALRILALEDGSAEDTRPA